MSPRAPKEWTDLGNLDPLWAVYTAANRKYGGWNDAIDEFFETGKREVEADLEGLAFVPGTAVDFGCGVGRLSQALAQRFERVIGIDVSAPMIEQARRLVKAPNCDFRLSLEPKLPVPDASVDLVYSRLVLQHMSRDEAVAYIRDFARVLKMGGFAVFQAITRLPIAERVQPRYAAYRFLRRIGLSPPLLYRAGLAPVRLSAVPFDSVTELLARGGLELLVAKPNRAAGPKIESHTFYARRLP